MTGDDARALPLDPARVLPLDPARVLPLDTTGALLLGRMAQAGEPALATLPLARGALALGDDRLWLAQPQLLGGPSVASVPLTDVGAVEVREHRGRLGPRTEVVLRLAGRSVRLRAGADPAPAQEFARAVAEELRRRG